MSKELEELEHIYYGSQGYGETDKYYKHLKEYLESIDNSNPSEALELLGFMGNFIIPTALGNKHLKDFCDKEFAIIKQALLKAQKEHKTKRA